MPKVYKNEVLCKRKNEISKLFNTIFSEKIQAENARP